MSIFKDCDVRGIYGTELLPRDAYAIGRGLCAMLPPQAVTAVGGDVRLSTPALKAELIRGLTDGGAEVHDLGTVPTPMLYFAHSTGAFDGSATVTASHNPPEYNGIKFVLGDTPLTPETVRTLRGHVERGEAPLAARKGTVTAEDMTSRYTKARIARFCGQKPLKIVVDAGNGAMSLVAPQVLRALGHDVIEVFCTPDGAFSNRSPNPAEYSVLGEACRVVHETGADFGVAFDGDGDRAVFIDDSGTPVQNEKSLVLFIRELLKERPSPVVYDQKSSGVVRKAVLAAHGTPIPERSGHAFIKKHFLEVQAAVAGEVSGHFFFGELGYDDGLFAACVMAQLLGQSARPLSGHIRDIVCPPITPDLRIACPYAEQEDWLARIEALTQTHPCEVTHLDGVRLQFEDGWLLMRKSVTAEQVTFRAESETVEGLARLKALAAQVLPQAAKAVLLGKEA